MGFLTTADARLGVDDSAVVLLAYLFDRLAQCLAVALADSHVGAARASERTVFHAGAFCLGCDSRLHGAQHRSGQKRCQDDSHSRLPGANEKRIHSSVVCRRSDCNARVHSRTGDAADHQAAGLTSTRIFSFLPGSYGMRVAYF